jgi:hypothetical protein
MTVERLHTVTHCEGSVYPSDHFPVVAELRAISSSQMRTTNA